MRKRILIIEDDDNNLKIYQLILDKANRYDIIVKKSGMEGYETFCQIQPDLLILDMHLPDMDGLKILKKIRENAQFKSIPIVAVTASAMMGDREKILSYGANEYMSKPIRLNSFLEIVARLTPDSIE